MSDNKSQAVDKVTIYQVTTEGDVEGRSVQTLGYCTGNTRDIVAYFKDRKYYNLFIKSIDVMHIDEDTVAEKSALLEEKQRIESRLEFIKNKLK